MDIYRHCMTKAQRRVAQRLIDEGGTARFNQLNRKPIEAMKEAGLITAALEVEPRANGRHALIYVVTKAWTCE